MGHGEADHDQGPAAADTPARTIGKVDLIPAAGGTAEAKAVRALPGFKAACTFIAAALSADVVSMLLTFDGQSCEVQWRTPKKIRHKTEHKPHEEPVDWQAREPLGKDAADPLRAVLKALAAPLGEAAAGLSAGDFIISEKCRWRCRVTLRKADKRETWLLQFSADVSAATGLAQRIGGMVSGFLPTGRPKTDAGQHEGGQNAFSSPPPLHVQLQPTGTSAAVAAGDGLTQANGLCGRALAVRACCLRLESAGGAVAIRVDVDGEWQRFDPLDKPTGAAVLAAVKAVAGLSADAVRPRQTGKCMTVVEGKPWPCTVTAIRVKGGERLEMHFAYGQPIIKTLAGTDMPENLRGRVQEFMSLAQGVLVLVAPRRHGLSTLFEQVMLTADRLTRYFFTIEDAAAPQRELQNVKTSQWDVIAKISPVDAVRQAMEEYPQGLATCDLTDAELAKKLVELAHEGQFVVIGINGGDVGEALSTILGFGVPAEQLGRVLLGGVGSRLIRKLCPKCREEYLPSLEELARVRLDPAATTTLWRAHAGGCQVCCGSGYFGRTGIFEIATGQTLQRYVTKGADASTLRKAAVKDGMVPLTAAAIELVRAGVTSLDEVRRVFAPPSSQTSRPTPPAG